jgi:penicillin-binding protein 2
VDVRDALAVSSNIFFYHLGGGYAGREGLGIWKINEYMNKFGFGVELGEEYFKGPEGIIPDPDWKEEIFEDDWRLGDTYFTSIGQYGFQITPLQALRATSAIATGSLIEPVLEKDSIPMKEEIDFIDDNYQEIVQDGMREAVLRGTAKGLNRDHLPVAAKTGTAELGASKSNVNSWVIGYFPYDDPKYIFTVMMEQGPRDNYLGGVFIMSQFMDWMLLNKEEYFR